jgi:hypothetical protein
VVHQRACQNLLNIAKLTYGLCAPISENLAKGVDKFKVPVEIRVEFFEKNSTDKVKGTWMMEADAASDNRLYVYSMHVHMGALPLDQPAPSTLFARADMNDMNEETEDRVYDFLESIGITDAVAHFVKSFTVVRQTSDCASVLTQLSTLLKESVVHKQ